jgi:hypothetical protein
VLKPNGDEVSTRTEIKNEMEKEMDMRWRWKSDCKYR